MSDSYQAVYDAARSKIRTCNTSEIIESVARNAFDMSYVQPRLLEAIGAIESDLRRPFVLLRPRMMLDGKQWLALYGENIQDGVCGFGDSPDAASFAFDKAWTAAIAPSHPPANSGGEHE